MLTCVPLSGIVRLYIQYVSLLWLHGVSSSLYECYGGNLHPSHFKACQRKKVGGLKGELEVYIGGRRLNNLISCEYHRSR